MFLFKYSESNDIRKSLENLNETQGLVSFKLYTNGKTLYVVCR